jgi:hypothetical protein
LGVISGSLSKKNWGHGVRAAKSAKKIGLKKKIFLPAVV